MSDSGLLADRRAQRRGRAIVVISLVLALVASVAYLAPGGRPDRPPRHAWAHRAGGEWVLHETPTGPAR